MEICKIHRKLMIFKSQYCFANISATKAPIFMKFETFIHEIVKNYQMIFRKDPCIHTHTRRVNVRTRVHLHLLCTRVSTDLYKKSFDNFLLSYECKSQIS